jgi:hypothetical protein
MLPSSSEVIVRRGKSESLVRGALTRDVAALRRRVQALEKAVWPTARAATTVTSPKRRIIEVDETTARRAAIEAFHQADRDEWLRKNPEIMERRRLERERLNAYLRERGFASEPE